MLWRKKKVSVVAICVAMLMATASAAVADDDHEGSDTDVTHLYAPKPSHDAKKQIADLVSDHNKDDAALIWAMATTPQAVWIESGTPQQARREVRKVVKKAEAKDSIPVLVAYNIPFRDCAQFSAGGATTAAEYKAWIDGVAAGIGTSTAMVILGQTASGLSRGTQQLMACWSGVSLAKPMQPPLRPSASTCSTMQSTPSRPGQT